MLQPGVSQNPQYSLSMQQSQSLFSYPAVLHGIFISDWLVSFTLCSWLDELSLQTACLEAYVQFVHLLQFSAVRVTKSKATAFPRSWTKINIMKEESLLTLFLIATILPIPKPT